MKIWVDDVRPAPNGYVWLKTVVDVISRLIDHRCEDIVVELLDLDHDAGRFATKGGGDYIKILDYMEEYHVDDIPIHIHSMNPVGIENMRRIIRRNGWKEV